LKQNEKFSFHVVTAKREKQRLKEIFSDSFRNVIAIDSVPDEKLYMLYLAKIIEELDIKILLISHSSIVYPCIPELKRKYQDLKIIDILHLERVGPVRDEMLWVNPYIDKRVCISHGLRKHMIAKVGTENGNASRFTTIYNGIDLNHYKDHDSLKGRFRSKFNIPEDVKLVSFIARFSEEKNPFIFIDIAKNIIKNNLNIPVKFIMAGDGDLFTQVKKTIQENGLSDHIILTGMLENIQELLADTYLLIVVSNNEGIPLTVMESLAMNTPVVSTVVGQTEEILKDGSNGYLIAQDENMVTHFTTRTLDLIKDKSLYQSLTTNSREKLLDEFSQEHMSNQYEQIFCKLMENGSNKNE